MDSNKKAIIIGIDGPIEKRLKKYSDDGKLPNIKALIDQGVYAKNCFVPYPTVTPPNWASISTGSMIGTHGITDFYMYDEKDPLDITHQALSTKWCRSEFIWDTLAKNKLNSIILNYPVSWPPTNKDVTIIGGEGLGINEIRREWSLFGECDIANDQLFSNIEYPESSILRLKKAENWKGVSLNDNDLEADMTFKYREVLDKRKIKVKKWHILVRSDDNLFNSVIISRSKNLKDKVCELNEGQWSSKITESFQTDTKDLEAVFMIKLIKLSKDATEIKIYMTPLCNLNGFSQPEGLIGKIKSNGLPSPGMHIPTWEFGWWNLDTFFEYSELQNIWYADAAEYLMENYPWDLFIMHAHLPDWIYHVMLNNIEPSIEKDKNVINKFSEFEYKCYKSIDDLVGKIMKIADENTFVNIISDHGAQPTRKVVNVNRLLMDNGLLKLKKDSSGTAKIDWKNTKAFAQRGIYVYINTKERNKYGSVENNEYEKIRDEVLNILSSHIDKDTGKRVFSMIFKKEDAHFIGLYGDGIGDIVYAYDAGFGNIDKADIHGTVLPATDYGVGSMKGIFILKGPGIKKSVKLERNVGLIDLVPTLCHLIGWPIPKDAEGAIIYQAMEDPDMRQKELDSNIKNYQRYKNAYKMTQGLTHSFSVDDLEDEDK
ncbi:alkaline phosphatase family protein [Actinomycetota bacterium]